MAGGADSLKPGQRRKLAPGSLEAQVEKVKASIRAKVEHPFLDVKQRFNYAKVRYRGLAKNTERIAILLGLSNLTTAQRAWAADPGCSGRKSPVCSRQRLQSKRIPAREAREQAKKTRPAAS